MFAFDPGSGREIWTMHHPNGCQVTPAYKDGVLYATCFGTLYAFDAHLKGGDDGIKDKPESGDRYDVLWTAALAAKTNQSPILFVDDAVVLNTSEGLEFYPTKVKDFTTVERTKIVKTGGSDGAGAAHNGTILVAASKTGHVGIEIKTGKELWRAESGSGSTPVIDGASTYFADARGTLWCVELATGRELWKVEGGFSSTPAAPAVSGGVVYMASNKPGAMNAVDAKSGGKLWSWTVPDKTKNVASEDYANAVYSTPMVADGRVFFTSYTGFLYCLRAERAPKERLAWKEKIAEQVCMTVPMAYEGAVYVRGENATFKFGAK